MITSNPIVAVGIFISLKYFIGIYKQIKFIFKSFWYRTIQKYMFQCFNFAIAMDTNIILRYLHFKSHVSTCWDAHQSQWQNFSTCSAASKQRHYTPPCSNNEMFWLSQKMFWFSQKIWNVLQPGCRAAAILSLGHQ